jgi:hypothetical protein
MGISVRVGKLLSYAHFGAIEPLAAATPRCADAYSATFFG